MIEIHMTDDRDKQVDRIKGNYLPCVVCGRAVKQEKYFIRVFYGATAVTDSEAKAIIERDGSGGDLLYYPIGANCLRNHPELKPYVDDAAKAIE